MIREIVPFITGFFFRISQHVSIAKARLRAVLNYFKKQNAIKQNA